MSTKIVPVPLCQKVSLWNLLTSCLPGLTYFNLYQGLNYLITMCNFTQMHFMYDYIYTSTHGVKARWWGLVEVFLYPFQRCTRMVHKRTENSKKQKAGGSHLVNLQPTSLSEKKTEENFAKGNSENFMSLLAHSLWISVQEITFGTYKLSKWEELKWLLFSLS